MSSQKLQTILNHEDLIIKRRSQLKIHQSNSLATIQPTRNEDSSTSKAKAPIRFPRDIHRSMQVNQISFSNTNNYYDDMFIKTFEGRVNGLVKLQLNGEIQKIIDEKGFNSESQLKKLSDAIQNLTFGLERASKCEVELGKRKRDLERRNHEYADLDLKQKTLQQKYDDLSEMNENLKSKIEENSKQNRQNQHNLLLEQRKCGELQHKIQSLEQRLELILESDFINSIGGGTQIKQLSEQSQQNLRKSLTELVKECEGYKRDIGNKNKEINRLQEQLKLSQQRVQKINQKVEMMKNKISIRELENINNTATKPIQSDEIVVNPMKDDPTALLTKFELCETLDFRINSLRTEYADIIHDIQEQGSSVFAQKVMNLPNPKQQREHISLITSQYLSFKDNAEKFNTFMKYSIKLIEQHDLRSQMIFIAQSVKNVFMSERCHLWIMDALNGMLYTWNENSDQVRAIMNRGIFAEVIRFQKPVHKRDGAIKALYFETACGKFVTPFNQSLFISALVRANQTLCYPIFNNSICGLIQILEISNSYADYFSFDEEYYGVILAKLCESLIVRATKRRLQETTISFNQMIFEASLALNNSQSFHHLYRIARHHIQSILSISQLALYFVDFKRELFITYTTQGSTLDGISHQNTTTQGQVYANSGSKVAFSWNQGIAAQVRLRQKSLIVMDARKSVDYDETVDLNTLLPLFVIPIKLQGTQFEDTKNVVGILEVPIKQRFLLKTAKDDIYLGSSSIVGLDDSFEIVALRMADCISQAIHLLQRQIKDF